MANIIAQAGFGLVPLIVAMLGPGGDGPAPAKQLTATITEVGIVQPAGKQIKSENASSATGFVTRGDTVLQERTTRVPAVQGTSFGLTYRLEGIPTDRPVRLTQVIRHPPMKRPDGTVIREQSSYQDVESSDGYVEAKLWYILRESHEVVPGNWTFSVLAGDHVLVEQRFHVVPTGAP